MKLIKLIKYYPNGEIYSIFGFPENELDNFVFNNVKQNEKFIVTNEEINFQINYIDENSQIKTREKKPSIYHEWINYQWELNKEKQITQESIDIRNKRNELLQQSDWTDTLSAKNNLGNELYLKWQDYRQALRNLPQQDNFPLSIVWPSKPE